MCSYMLVSRHVTLVSTEQTQMQHPRLGGLFAQPRTRETQLVWSIAVPFGVGFGRRHRLKPSAIRTLTGTSICRDFVFRGWFLGPKALLVGHLYH